MAGALAVLAGAAVLLGALVVALVAGGDGARAHARPAQSKPGLALSATASALEEASARRGAEQAELRRLAALGLPVYCAGHRGHLVALTFDDGPGPYTRLALDKLRRHHLRATFFIVGRNIPLVPGITRRERAIGAVGDHTFTHPLLTALPPVTAEEEILRTRLALERSSGGPVTLFRPPYGGHDATIDAIARQLGMVQVLWTVDSGDSLGADYAGIARNVIRGMHPGAIILMHENRGQTIRALLPIFAALARRHLRAASVPQLLSQDPPSLAQLRAGGRGCGSRAVKATGGS
jgi:peptidoglycan/xylan/chitin deacetylase (PgdA/CDA1 family)